MAWNTRIDIEESAEIKQCPFCGVPGHLRKFVGWNEKIWSDMGSGLYKSLMQDTPDNTVISNPKECNRKLEQKKFIAKASP